MLEYTLLKTASATAKKNGLQCFKNLYGKKCLLDLDILNDVEGVPDDFKRYVAGEVQKDLTAFGDFSLLFYDISDFERITAKIYFKQYTINTEDKNAIYRIFKAVKVEYCHTIIDPWNGQKTVINEFVKTIGTDYTPEEITAEF